MKTSLWIVTATFMIGMSTPAQAEDLRVYPTEVYLNHREDSQQLLLVKTVDGRTTADLSNKATWRIANATIATVDATGRVQAVGDGETTITAKLGEQSATAKIRVSGTGQRWVPSFRQHVQAVLTKASCNSGACHGALAGKGGFKLSLRGYDHETDYFVLTRQANARRVDRQRPQESLILTKPTRILPHAGGRKFDVDSTDYQILHDWIAAGAPGPSAADARLTRLEVFPPHALLKPQDEIQVIVRAWWSDGRCEDVTAWSRFGSSEEQVVKVDDAGKVTVSGPGEAVVHVGYADQIATVTVTVPFGQRLADTAYDRFSKNNFIDEYVLRKLRELRLPPSEICSDNEFIRRVFLDTAGILPTPKEVEAFLQDQRPDKRSRLIDALLNRPETIDYWTYKWCDLLLVSTRQLPQPAMLAFHRAVRQAVADNRPWDQFARDLLTARGSTLQQGLGNYFVLHKDVAELTEATAVTFLGMSITCARCHNHPLEKWTQDQYWSMASLFARVGLKNGDRPGEVIVSPLASGEILHPRRNVAMPPAPLDAPPLQSEVGDRRVVFADWLTKPDNPFFARAVVNRVWRNFFGRGLIEAEDDLRETNPPSHPELLQALVQDFIRHQYDMKHLMRVILNSHTYQLSSKSIPGNENDTKFLSRYQIRRLSAEVILDAYSQVTEVPTRFDRVVTGVEGNTAPTSNYPLGMRALQLPDTQVASRFLDAFGRPERVQTCSCERQQDSSVAQALHLNNGPTLNEKLRAKESILEKWLQEKRDDASIIRELFMRAFCRQPEAEELKKLLSHLSESDPTKIDQRREALQDLFWAILTTPEFLFNH